jgi:hypothetical protein
MGLITGERLPAEVVSLPESIQSARRRRGGRFLTEHSLQPFDDEALDGGAATGGSDFGPLQNTIWQIDGCFHKAINTGIWLQVKK